MFLLPDTEVARWIVDCVSDAGGFGLPHDEIRLCGSFGPCANEIRAWLAFVVRTIGAFLGFGLSGDAGTWGTSALTSSTASSKASRAIIGSLSVALLLDLGGVAWPSTTAASSLSYVDVSRPTASEAISLCWSVDAGACLFPLGVESLTGELARWRVLGMVPETVSVTASGAVRTAWDGGELGLVSCTGK